MQQRPFSTWSELRHRPRLRLLIEDPGPALQPAEFRPFEDDGCSAVSPTVARLVDLLGW